MHYITKAWEQKKTPKPLDKLHRETDCPEINKLKKKNKNMWVPEKNASALVRYIKLISPCVTP